MAILAGAKHFTSNNGLFLIFGATAPDTQDTMPIGDAIPGGSLYVNTTGAGSSLWIFSNRSWVTFGGGFFAGGVVQKTSLAQLETDIPIGSTNILYVTLDDNKVYVWNGTAYEEASPSQQTNIPFTALLDVPHSYTSKAGYKLAVNSTANGIGFVNGIIGNIYYIGVNGNNSTAVMGSPELSYATFAAVNALTVDGDSVVIMPGVVLAEAPTVINDRINLHLCVNVTITTFLSTNVPIVISGESRYSSIVNSIDFKDSNTSTIENCRVNNLYLWAAGGGQTAKATGCYITNVDRSTGTSSGFLTLSNCEVVTTTSNLNIAYQATNCIFRHSGSDLYLCNGYNLTPSLEHCTVVVTGGFYVRMGAAGQFKTLACSFSAAGIILHRIASVSSPQAMIFEACYIYSSTGTYSITQDNDPSGNSSFIGLRLYNSVANKTFDAANIPIGVATNTVIDVALF